MRQNFLMMNKKGRFNSFYLITLIFTIYIFDYADRHIMSSILPFIKDAWHISDAQSGLLTSVVSLSIGIFTIPLSILVDRWSRKNMIAIMVGIWSLATLCCAFANNYTQLLIFRSMTGLGEAAYASAAVAMITKAFPQNYRSRYIGLYNAAAPLGAGLGMFVGGYIGTIWGWKHAFGLVAAPGLILAILFLFVKDYRTVELEESSNNTFRSTMKAVGDLLRIRTLWYVYIAYALMIGMNTSILSWIPSYFVRFLKFSPKEAGTIAGAMAAMVLIGAPIGGILSDKYSSTNRDAKLYVSAVSSILACLALWATVLSPNRTMAIISVFLFGIFSIIYLAPITSVIQEVVNPGVRAVAYGFNVMFMNLIGAFITPIVIGRISDIIGLDKALLILPVTGIVATILFLAVKRQYHRDLDCMSNN